MRNPIYVYKLLEILEARGPLARELLFSGYTGPFRGVRMVLAGERASKPNKPNSDSAKHRFSNLLFRLRRDGLVEVDSGNISGRTVRLTENGKNWLRQKRHLLMLSTPQTDEKDYLKIVIFDIPEAAKKKRQWLRNMLVLCGYTMLQKSVWVGDQKLPAGFMECLRDLGISHFVHIFAVSRPGTLA